MNKTEPWKNLEKLNSLILGPALIKDAYSIDVIQRKIFIRYYNKAYAGLELIKSQGAFLACRYADWEVFIKQEA